MILPPPETQDLGPFRVDLLRAIWPRIERVVATLHSLGAIRTTAPDLTRVVEASGTAGAETVDHADLARALCVMASADNMHVGDWLRRTVADSQMPRRKAPAPVDLQLRLRGLMCRRLVAQVIEDAEVYRVTIRTLRGDVVSVESTSFENALDGAIKMAGGSVGKNKDKS